MLYAQPLINHHSPLIVACPLLQGVSFQKSVYVYREVKASFLSSVSTY